MTANYKANIAAGLLAAEVLEVSGYLARAERHAAIKPLDKESVLKAANECGKIVACEEQIVQVAQQEIRPGSADVLPDLFMLGNSIEMNTPPSSGAIKGPKDTLLLTN